MNDARWSGRSSASATTARVVKSSRRDRLRQWTAEAEKLLCAQRKSEKTSVENHPPTPLPLLRQRLGPRSHQWLRREFSWLAIGGRLGSDQERPPPRTRLLMTHRPGVGVGLVSWRARLLPVLSQVGSPRCSCKEIIHHLLSRIAAYRITLRCSGGTTLFSPRAGCST